MLFVKRGIFICLVSRTIARSRGGMVVYFLMLSNDTLVFL